MKTDRFSSLSIRTVAVLLAGLLLAAGHPAVGQFRISIGRRTITVESSSKKLAKALAQQVGVVQQRFGESRRALPTVTGPLGEPAYVLSDVAGLVARTGEDLDKAIAQIGEPGLEALDAWAAEELRPIQEQLAAPASRTAILPPGLFTPRAVAVVASLGWLRLPELASVKAAAPKKAPKQGAPKKAAPKPAAPKPAAPKPAAPKPAAPKPAAPKPAVPKQETIPSERANALLDQVGEVVGRIFLLASHDDLEVKLWVGSTPAPRVKFSFRPQGQIKESPSGPVIIQTNGKKDHVLRGLYSYEAAWTKGAVTQVIRYPNPAGAPAAQMGSERLDLVKDTGFFCCQFKDGYCRHVTNEKECRFSAAGR